MNLWARVEVAAALERISNHADALQMQLLGDMARDEALWDSKGRCYASEEIATRMGLSGYEADQCLAEAMALSTCHTRVLDAMRAGTVDHRKARIVLDEVCVLPADRAREVAGRVVEQAPGLAPAEVRDVVRAEVIAVDPQAAAGRHERERRRRSVGMDPERDGMARVWAYLPVDQALTAWKAITAMSARQGPEDPRTLPQRRADAFTATFADVLERGTGPTGPLTRRKGRRNGLLVTMDGPTLAGLGSNPAYLAGHGPVAAEIGRRIAADAAWQRLLTDPRGRVVGIDVDTWKAGWTAPGPQGDGVDSEDPFGPDPEDPDDAEALEGPWRIGAPVGRGFPDARPAPGSRAGGGPGSDGDDEWIDLDALGEDPGGPDEYPDGPEGYPDDPEEDPGGAGEGLEDPEDGWPGVEDREAASTRPGRESGRPEEEIRDPEEDPGPPEEELGGPGVAPGGPGAAFGAAPPRSPTGQGPAHGSGARGEASVTRGRRAPPVGYRPSAWLVALVRARDRRCAFPGCRMPAERCDLDHIVPFDAALPARLQTTAANLAPLCRRHHEAKTTRTWSYTRQAATGLYTWTSPTGHTYTRPADPVATPP